jgi:hypothetical protein
MLTALQSLVGWPLNAPTRPSASEKSIEQLALSPLAFSIILPTFAVGEGKREEGQEEKEERDTASLFFFVLWPIREMKERDVRSGDF